MGGKDSPPPQYVSTNPPNWESQASTMGRSKPPPIEYVPRSKSAVNLDMGINASRAAKKPLQISHSVPASPNQQPKSSSTSSSSRSSGSISPIRQYMECIEPQTLSCAIVGDSGVGKTSLLMSYTTGKVPQDHAPTIYDKFSSKLKRKGKKLQVVL